MNIKKFVLLFHSRIVELSDAMNERKASEANEILVVNIAERNWIFLSSPFKETLRVEEHT